MLHILSFPLSSFPAFVMYIFIIAFVFANAFHVMETLHREFFVLFCHNKKTMVWWCNHDVVAWGRPLTNFPSEFALRLMFRFFLSLHSCCRCSLFIIEQFYSCLQILWWRSWAFTIASEIQRLNTLTMQFPFEIFVSYDQAERVIKVNRTFVISVIVAVWVSAFTKNGWKRKSSRSKYPCH